MDRGSTSGFCGRSGDDGRLNVGFWGEGGRGISSGRTKALLAADRPELEPLDRRRSSSYVAEVELDWESCEVCVRGDECEQGRSSEESEESLGGSMGPASGPCIFVRC